jgi:3',5'-cyclic AMP phosphodiesterase CpdA
MEITLLHASDIHFGKRFDPEAMDGFLRFVDAVTPDLLVLSGDFTQRAKVREYREARKFLDDLPRIPTVVTPGNHDVPLYRIWERVFLPHRNYRRYISQRLDYATHLPGVTVVALDSTAPRRAIVNGRIEESQLRYAAGAFEAAQEGDIKILVTHHNLALAPDPESDKILPGHIRCLEAFSRMGVELVISGHLHRGFVRREPSGAAGPETSPPMTIVHAGTTTSTRGRVGERGKNSLNLIRIGSEEILIEPQLFQRDTGEFSPSGRQALPRRSVLGRGEHT